MSTQHLFHQDAGACAKIGLCEVVNITCSDIGIEDGQLCLQFGAHFFAIFVGAVLPVTLDLKGLQQQKRLAIDLLETRQRRDNIAKQMWLD